ncbi:hypothetical protein ACFUJ0_12495 [Streptomyces sp. NPDC057242]|uniref:hypothetical protein n=1 Tax=unclassified Streptomyces TaxID=2593676 RepID=UPI00362908B8
MSKLTDFHGDVTGLLTAIVEALDVPTPSTRKADEQEHHTLLTLRAADVRIALAALLRYPGAGVLDDTVQDIRRWTLRHPVTYTPFHSQKQGEEG